MDFEDPPPDPIAQFQIWLEEAKRTALPNPNAMTLATVDPDGRPSARIVLLKSFDAQGAVFFTNYESAKAKALAVHPHACLLFHWDTLERQVRIDGPVERVTAAESDAYFAQRPRESRLGAWASLQSQPVDNRAGLEARLREMERTYPDEIPRPSHWGGYRIAIESIEFWQGHRFRLHDRIRYTRTGSGWSVQRLYP